MTSTDATATLSARTTATDDDQLAALRFGHHVRGLRRARGLTQDHFAARCRLSADTIRRLEAGTFSPSLNTLRKIGSGLGLTLSTVFETFELGEVLVMREIVDLLANRTPGEHAMALGVLRRLFDELDRLHDVAPVIEPSEGEDDVDGEHVT